MKIGDGFRNLINLQDKKIEKKEENEVQEVCRIDGGIWQRKWMQAQKRWEKACAERDNYEKLWKAEKEKNKRESTETSNALHGYGGGAGCPWA